MYPNFDLQCKNLIFFVIRHQRYNFFTFAFLKNYFCGLKFFFEISRIFLIFITQTPPPVSSSILTSLLLIFIVNIISLLCSFPFNKFRSKEYIGAIFSCEYRVSTYFCFTVFAFNAFLRQNKLFECVRFSDKNDIYLI